MQAPQFKVARSWMRASFSFPPLQLLPHQEKTRAQQHPRPRERAALTQTEQGTLRRNQNERRDETRARQRGSGVTTLTTHSSSPFQPLPAQPRASCRRKSLSPDPAAALRRRCPPGARSARRPRDRTAAAGASWTARLGHAPRSPHRPAGTAAPARRSGSRAELPNGEERQVRTKGCRDPRPVGAAAARATNLTFWVAHSASARTAAPRGLGASCSIGPALDPTWRQQSCALGSTWALRSAARCCSLRWPWCRAVSGNGAPHERRGVSAIRILESSRQLATGQDPPGDPHANGGMSGGARCLAVQIQEEMLITAHGQDIVSRYSYWKFKSRNPADYVQCAHPHSFR